MEVPAGQERFIEKANLKLAEQRQFNYEDSYVAFFEFTDNAFDNQIVGEPFQVIIRIEKNSLVITNKGGKTTGKDALRRFFAWGESEKDTTKNIGRYGEGAKAAAAYLGKELNIQTGAKGDTRRYNFVDQNWNVKPAQSEVEHVVPYLEGDPNEFNYFTLIVNKLNHPSSLDVNRLMKRLSSIHKKKLEKPGTVMTVNGLAVAPLKIPYEISNPSFEPENWQIRTGRGGLLPMTVGILPEEFDRQVIKPGFRVYFHERMIEDGMYFGLSMADTPQLNRLIGEVSIDQARVTNNKTRFDKDDPVFVEASRRVASALQTQGWLDKLKTLSIEMNKPDRFEYNVAKRARDSVSRVLAQSKLLSIGLVPGDTTVRQKYGGGQGGAGQTSRSSQGGNRGFSGESRGNTVEVRQNIFTEWQPVPFGEPNLRSRILGTKGKERLEINTDFPMYQARKKSGSERNLEIYMGETALAELGMMLNGDKGLAAYQLWLNEAVRRLGEYYVKQQTAKQSSRSLSKPG